MKRVAFLVQLPKEVSPGQRFRIEQYEPLLQQKGIAFDTFSFLDTATYSVLYKPGHYLQKIKGVLAGFGRRIIFLFKAKKYDFVFLQREAAPIGPPLFEWVLAKVLKKKLVLDFDDAIWIADKKGSRILNFIKCYWKVRYLIRWSAKVAVGNNYLAQYAKQYNDCVLLLPTCVDMESRYSQQKKVQEGTPVIGWTGSHSTLKYLSELVPVFEKLETHSNFKLLIICNQPPDFKLKSLLFIPWNRQTEIMDLLQMDIGIMPLQEDAWSKGKCGFKLIQYMALGIPAIASPAGVNKEIVQHGINGLLCADNKQWLDALEALIKNTALRKKIGEAGKRTIENRYSVQVHGNTFTALFD